jgi:hypothetical protein
MMMAMLRQAMADFEENASATGQRKRKLFKNAKDWIFDEGKDWLFSFENICANLGLNPDFLRGELLTTSARRL